MTDSIKGSVFRALSFKIKKSHICVKIQIIIQDSVQALSLPSLFLWKWYLLFIIGNKLAAANQYLNFVTLIISEVPLCCLSSIVYETENKQQKKLKQENWKCFLSN